MTDPRTGARAVRGELPGVFRCARGSDAVVAAAEAAGWRIVTLDTDEADSKQGFLEACADAFGLPDWFGMNWDALDEALGDLELGGVRGLMVTWSGWQELAEAEPGTVATALDVFATAVRGWIDDGLPATVLVVGAGDDLDLPSV